MYTIRDRNSGKVLCHSYYRGNVSADWHLIHEEDITSEVYYLYEEPPCLDNALDDAEGSIEGPLSLYVKKEN